MKLPSTERVVFSENPLAAVVCQLTFPRILEIASGEPATFQKKIRKDYPFYEVESEGILPSDIMRLMKDAGLQPPQTTHKFLNEDRSVTIALNPEFVAISTSRYTLWESFRDRIEMVRTAVEEIYEPSFYTRVGLRYQDIIWPERLGLDDVAWSELINPGLLGPLGLDFFAKDVNETQTTTIVRISDEGELLGLRQGLVKKKDSQENGYLIDADFFASGKVGSENVLRRLNEYNKLAGDLFRWAISDRLMDALGPTDVGRAVGI